MSEADELFDKASRLSNEDLETFLAGLTEEERRSIRQRLAAARASDLQSSSDTIVPNTDPDGTIDHDQLAKQEQPRFVPPPANLDKRKQSSVPDRIGPYKILQRIGEGGMGQVFLAEQREPIKRRVAIKLINTETPTDRVLARFAAERQALAMMDHQNIAKVLDAGVAEDGRPYFAMELVKGIPITEYCDKNRLTPGQRLELFVQTCRAIQHAHQKGVIHRDLKPGNVLVTLYDGKPIAKVIDFGLAKAINEQTHLTHRTLFTEYGQIVGTLEYMSPEQAEMSAIDIDTRTDVYSLGIILYELLTGSTPIGRDRLRSEAFDRILALIREEDAQRPSARLSESGDAISGISDLRRTDPGRLGHILKGDLDWIAMKAIEKDRSRRYDGPASLADDVQRFLNDEPIEARPPTFAYRFQKAFRKHRLAFLSIAAIAAMLITAVAASSWFAIQANDSALAEKRQREIADQKTIDADDSAKEALAKQRLALAAQKETEATLARADYRLAVARWDAGRVGDARERLEHVPAQYRDLAWRLAKRDFQGEGMVLNGHHAAVFSVTYSPDGTKLLSGDADGVVKVWDVESGKILHSIQAAHDSIKQVRFRPNGKQFATADRRGDIKTWDVATGSPVKSFNGHSFAVYALNYSPDGKIIASGSDNDNVRLWNADSGELLESVGDSSFMTITGLEFSADGNQLLIGNSAGQLKLLDIKQKVFVWQKYQLGNIAGIAFRAGSDNFLTAHSSGEFVLWRLSQNIPVGRIKVSSTSASSVSISPNGSDHASAVGNVIQLWSLTSGELIREFRGHVGSVESVAFRPDAKRIVSGGTDGSIRIWMLDAEGPELQQQGQVSRFSVTSNPSQLVTVEDKRNIAIWDIRSGKRTSRFETSHQLEINDLAVNPNGTLIATAGEDTHVKLIAMQDGKELWSIGRGVSLWAPGIADDATWERGHYKSVRSVCFSPNGELLATTGSDQAICVWDVSTKALILTLRGHHKNSIYDLCFSEDGSKLLTSDSSVVNAFDVDSGDKIWSQSRIVHNVTIRPGRNQLAISTSDRIELLDLDTGDRVHSLAGRAGFSDSLCFSDDGQVLLAAGIDNVKIWDVDPADELRTIPLTSTGVTLVDDELIVVKSGSELRVVDARPFEHGVTMLGTGKLVDFELSPGDDRIAAIADDQSVRIWDRTGAERVAIMTEDLREHSVRFSPTGDRIVTCGHDSMIRVWDAETGDAVLSFQAMTGDFPSSCRLASFNENGKLLFTSSRDVRNNAVYDAQTGEQLSSDLWSYPRPAKRVTADGKLRLGSASKALFLASNETARFSERQSSTESAKWHLGQAKSSTAENDPYAVVFHLAWAQKLGASRDSVRKQLLSAIEQMNKGATDFDWVVSLPAFAREIVENHRTAAN